MMNKIKQFLPLIITSVVFALVLTWNSFFMIAKIPTESMANTIKPGQYVLVFRTRDITRGDIVAFYSQEYNKKMVKRCIGTANDVIDCRKGSIYLNGEYLEEPYVSSLAQDDITFIVPDDTCLFLGDNRANSNDARTWDNPYIETLDIIGKVILEIYPEIKTIE